MDHNAANALIDAVQNACQRGIEDAVQQCSEANDALTEAISDAYNSGIPAHTVAAWLNWSKATYWRYLTEHNITRA